MLTVIAAFCGGEYKLAFRVLSVIVIFWTVVALGLWYVPMITALGWCLLCVWGDWPEVKATHSTAGKLTVVATAPLRNLVWPLWITIIGAVPIM